MKKVFSGLAVVCAAAAILASCHGGGGGTPLIGNSRAATYHSPDEAAASATAAGEASQTADALALSVSGFGDVQIPASLAPKLKAKRAAAAASFDPRLKTLLDNVSSKSKSAMVQAALQKMSGLKTSRAISTNATYTIDAGCTVSGNVQIVGQNNYDDAGRTADIASYTFTYNACSDGTNVVNGSLILGKNDVLSGLSWTDSMQMSNLTFYNSSIGDTVALNASFGTTATLTDYANRTMTFTGDGSFSDTLSTGEKIEFTFDGMSDKDTVSSDATQLTEELVLNGSVGFSFKDNTGALLMKFTQTASGFTDKYQVFNDGTGTMKRWLNGKVSLSWSPSIDGCSPGSVTFTTADATPITWTTAGGFEPVSGTMMVNTATIQYATPAAPQITVTLGNGSSKVYSNMMELYVCGTYCSVIL